MISDVHLLLTLMALYYFRCLIYAHWVGYVSSQMSWCQFWGWIAIVPSVPFCFLHWFSIISPGSPPLTDLSPHPVNCHTTSHWDFFFISSVSLPLTSVAQHCFTCPTSVHCRGVFASFYVFHWHSFGWCSIYTGVSLTLTLLVLCCTVVPLLLLGLFCIISGSHWHSFKWLNDISIVQ